MRKTFNSLSHVSQADYIIYSTVNDVSACAFYEHRHVSKINRI